MTVMPLGFVQAPPLTPPEYGILSAAVVVDDTDPHAGFGFEYQPEFCGPAELTVAACLTPPSQGTLGINSGASRLVTVTVTGAGAGSYTVWWGDGSSTQFVQPPGTAQHTYAADGTYHVTVVGNHYRAERDVPVSATGSGAQPGTTPTYVKNVDDGRDLVTGEPFVVYTLKNCRNVGVQDARGYAERALTAGEGRAVESWLGDRLAAEAVDLGGATALPVEVGLAVLEQYIHCNYGGVGTIHANRGVASLLLSGQALETGARLTTKLGNNVSAGCYGDDGAATDQYLYATGTVLLRRGPVFSPGDPVVDWVTNEQYALAERPYAGSWECFAVKIKVGASAARSTQAVSVTIPDEPPGPPLTTGTDPVEGPGGVWMAPAGNLRHVSVVVTSGSVEVNGTEVTAPNTVDFDADTDESLTPPSITASSAGDRAVVAWVAEP